MIPLFTSHYSGKSVLTFDTSEDAAKYNKDSIIDICLDNDIKNPFVIESKMTGFLEMYENFTEAKLNPRFGLTRIFLNEVSEENKPNWSKILIFCKNTEGYKDLIKLHNFSNIHNESYVDTNVLKNLWTRNLELVVPFYDSYIFRNVINGTNCLPEFNDIEHTFFWEDNALPFDDLVSSKIGNNKVKTKSIYYKNREDFKVWQTYKCSLNLNYKGRKRSLDSPNFEHCHSKEFCFESWKENINKV